MQLLPTVVRGLRTLRDSGCSLFLHTNQSGIGRGYFAHGDAVACNNEMLAQIGLGHALFERICIAPEAPDQAGAYRKPSPQFGLDIINDYAISKHEICYIGDNVSDMLTAKNLGCAGVGVSTGRHNLRMLLQERDLVLDFPVFATLADAASHIVDGLR